MKRLTKNATFEDARRWSLVAAIGAITLLVVVTILEAWGAIDFYDTGTDSWGYYLGEQTFWGKLQESLSIIAGFGFAVIVLVIFVLPRKKN